MLLKLKLQSSAAPTASPPTLFADTEINDMLLPFSLASLFAGRRSLPRFAIGPLAGLTGEKNPWLALNGRA
jgi:hypothetical protein